MSKFRALLVSALLATSLIGGAVAVTTDLDAGKAPSKAPTQNRDGSLWCC